jgi:tetratricopeptide (TPR) repeat protein
MNPAFIESYELLAKFYRDHKRADLAMDTYKKILEFSPVYVPALIKLSHLYYEQNNLLESQKYLEEAIKIQPKQERYWIELVNLLEEMGNYSLRSIIIQKAQKQGIQIPNSR